MIETIYSRCDLKSGKCRRCGKKSNEILKGDGRCIDCIEAEKFYEITMHSEKYNEDPYW